jgi:hypothetical protein
MLMAPFFLFGLAAAAEPPAAPLLPQGKHVFHGVDGDWKLSLKGGELTYVYRLPHYSELWWSQEAIAEPVADGIRVVGVLYKEDVVANEAVSDEMAFELSIVKRPCRDSRGRMRPVTASLTLRWGDAAPQEAHGCGRDVPALAPGKPAG